jgi:hypothetical protein
MHGLFFFAVLTYCSTTSSCHPGGWQPCPYLALFELPLCHTCHCAALSFALAGCSVSSCCAILVAPLPLDAHPLPPASHLPLLLPGWLLHHFSLSRLCITSPLIAPPPLIDALAGCCVASCCATSTLHQLSSRRRLSRCTGWLSRRLSSCRPLICASEGQPTMPKHCCPR